MISFGADSKVLAYTAPDGTKRFRARCMKCRPYSKRGKMLAHVSKTFDSIPEAKAWWTSHIESSEHIESRVVQSDSETARLADRIVAAVKFDTP